MGGEPEKEKIIDILEKSEINTYENKNQKIIEYKCNRSEEDRNEDEGSEESELSNEFSDDFYDSLDCCYDYRNSITSPSHDIKNINKFPYNSIGILMVEFPAFDE